MGTCAQCNAKATSQGVLCVDCVATIYVNDGLCPEQIASLRELNASAWLIDRWGRPHAIADQTLVGRRATLDIHCASISRKHALLETYDGGWRVVDLNSHNGTFINDVLVESASVIDSGDRVRFGTIRFFFVITDLDAEQVGVAEFGTRSAESEAPSRAAASESPPDSHLFQLISASRSGGGLLRAGGTEVRLTPVQFELIRNPWRADESRHGTVGGCQGIRAVVSTIEHAAMAFEEPDEVNLRQLVRRVRRRLADLDLVIEGRHGFGYRVCRSSTTA